MSCDSSMTSSRSISSPTCSRIRIATTTVGWPFILSLKSREHREQFEYEQTDEFRDYRRKRFAIEAKNSQLKNPQGLARNKTSDLKGMTLQGVMAIIAVNLKRIIALRKENTG